MYKGRSPLRTILRPTEKLSQINMRSQFFFMFSIIRKKYFFYQKILRLIFSDIIFFSANRIICLQHEQLKHFFILTHQNIIEKTMDLVRLFFYNIVFVQRVLSKRITMHDLSSFIHKKCKYIN